MAAPVKKIKYGTTEVAVFEKESEKYGKSQSFALTKSYKKDDTWVNQKVYLNNTADLLNVIQCCESILDWKYSRNEPKTENKGGSEPPI